MSLTTPYSEVYWSGNGVDKKFGFNFNAISEDYVKCVVYFPEGYSVVPSFSANIALGELTINSITTPEGEILQIPPVGSTIRIFRDVPEVQNATTSQLQAFTAKQLEKTLDNVVAMIQENKYDVEHKTIRTTETERDVSLQALSEENDEELLMWSEEQHALVASGLTKEDWEQTSAYAVAVAEEAKEIAEDAKGIAESADEKSDRALTNSLDAVGKAEQAITTAESAMDVAEQASEHADSALSLSQVAISKSNEAIATANTADIKATRAETKSDRAVATSDRAEQKSEEALAGVQSAIEAAERATEAAERAEQEIQTYDGRIQEAQDNAAEALRVANTKQDQLTSANAGVGIAITEEDGKTIISNTQTSAEWGNITGDITAQTDLQDALDNKTQVIIRSW